MAHIKKYKINEGKETKYKAIVEVGDSKTRQRKTKSFKRKKDAEEWLNEIIYSKNSGYKVDKNDITVGDRLDKWLQTKKATKRPTTYDRYKYKVNSHLKPYFGDILLQELEPKDIEDYLTLKRISGRRDGKEGGLSENTLKKHCVILNNMLKKAVKLKLIKTNPMNAIEMPKPEQYEALAMDENESKTLLKAAKQDDLMYHFIYTLLLTGMRRSEVLGLEWDKINFKEGYIDIKQALLPISQGSILESKLKSIEGKRKILMYNDLAYALKKYKVKQNELRLKYGKEYYDKNDFVFCHPDGKPYHPNTYYKNFKKLIKETGLNNKYYIHTLRHTFATLNLKNDVPMKIVQKMLGHTLLSTTADIYTHAKIEKQKDPISKLGKSLSI